MIPIKKMKSAKFSVTDCTSKLFPYDNTDEMFENKFTTHIKTEPFSNFELEVLTINHITQQQQEFTQKESSLLHFLWENRPEEPKNCH